MKIKLIVVGKTVDDYLKKGIQLYVNRIGFYAKFEMIEIPELKGVKSISFNEIKDMEGDLIMRQVDTTDNVVLLDEKGDSLRSLEFAEFVNKKMVSGIKNLVFIVGGAYGFSDKLYKRSNGSLSLSKMTFSHQMVRLIFAEQLYRAFSILKNEPYHHE